MSAPLLTDEQIADMRVSALMSPDAAHTEWVDLLARAVESATRAPLLAEIERLQAALIDRDAEIEVLAGRLSRERQRLTAERDAAMADAERLRARLAEPDDEPVAAQCRFPGVAWGQCDVELARMVMAAPNEWPTYEVRMLYTRPAARKVQPLTDGQITAGWRSELRIPNVLEAVAFRIGARYAERAHGITAESHG